VTDILVQEKKILLSDRLEFEYDRLIIALGAHPFIPPIEGVNEEGIMTLRSAEDAKELIQRIEKNKKVLIVGGGVLGLEAAGALASKGAQVIVAEGSSWLMPRQLNQEASLYVSNSLGKLGIQVEYDFRTSSIRRHKDINFEVISSDGRHVLVDTVVLATGVRPNTYLARKAGLEVDKGLVVDNYMKTSEEDIYGAGDITEHYGISYGLWNIAQYQGKIAALNLLGNKLAFGGVPRSNALKVLDIDLFSIGEIKAVDASYQELVRKDENAYLLMVIRDQQLVGSIAIGYKTVTHKIKKMVEQGQRLTPEQVSDISYIIDMLESK
jgi:nitrite reductase (NADH) large subunit